MAGQEARQVPGAEPGFFYGYIVVAAAFCSMVAMYGTRSIFGVFFKPMLAEFGWTRALTSGALSLSMLVQGSLAAVMGGLSDRFGPRVVLTLSACLVGLGYLLMSRVDALWQLYLFYGVIIGVGMSGVLVPLLSTVARWFVARRNMMTGIVVAGIGISGLIAPPLSNWLVSAYDWRVSWIVLGGIVLVVGVLAAQFLKRNPAQMERVPHGGDEGGEQVLKAGAGGFSPKEAVHTWQFWVVVAMFFCLGFCLFTILVHIVPHVTDLGISAASAANVLAIIGGAGIIGNIVLGGAGDRIGNRLVCLIGFILMVADLFWLVSVTEVWMFYLFAAILSFAIGGCTTAESPLVAALFGLKSHGLILGMVSFGFTIGGAVGPFLTGYIFDVTGSYRAAFLVCAAIGIVGLILTALLRPITGEQGKTKAI